MKQVVAALIVGQEGLDQETLDQERVLICQRTRHQTMPLKWEFPGGKIEPGESLEDALRRELEEELGVRATIGRKIATIRHEYRNGASSLGGTTRGTSVELHFFLVERFSGPIQNRIFNDLRWVKREEMAQYDFLEADVTLVEDIAAGRIKLAR